MRFALEVVATRPAMRRLQAGQSVFQQHCRVLLDERGSPLRIQDQPAQAPAQLHRTPISAEDRAGCAEGDIAVQIRSGACPGQGEVLPPLPRSRQNPAIPAPYPPPPTPTI